MTNEQTMILESWHEKVAERTIQTRNLISYCLLGILASTTLAGIIILDRRGDNPPAIIRIEPPKQIDFARIEAAIREIKIAPPTVIYSPQQPVYLKKQAQVIKNKPAGMPREKQKVKPKHKPAKVKQVPAKVKQVVETKPVVIPKGYRKVSPTLLYNEETSDYLEIN